MQSQPAFEGWCLGPAEFTRVGGLQSLLADYANGAVAGAGGLELLALLIIRLVGAAITAGRNPLPANPSASAEYSPGA